MNDQIREWLDLDDRRRALNAELRDVEERLKQLDEPIRDYFAENHIQTTRIGGRTMYVQVDRWPRPKDGDRLRLAEALRREGLEQYITVNTQSLRGYTNELIREYLETLPPAERAAADLSNALPHSLRDALEISEVFSLRGRKTQ